jgi:hypothetical protein
VQQAEKTAPETEPERRRRLRLEGDGPVGELELLEGISQLRQLVAVDRVEAAEDHGFRVAVTLEGRNRRLGGIGHGLADAGLGHGFDAGDEVADLARPELGRRLVMG